jgi:lysozyme family protein
MATDVIGDIIEREGGAVVTNDPADGGGRTQYGISEKSNPAAWADGKVTEAEARAIYQRKYIDGPGFGKIQDKQLQTQLVDFGVNSGPMVAIQKLQGILHVPVDGVLGPQTLTALVGVHPEDVCNLLVAARVRMIGQIVSKNPSQLRFLNGWLDRSLQFLV